MSNAAAKPATHVLTKVTLPNAKNNGGTAFCYFTVLGDDAVRVVACATWTAYESDFTVTKEEARKVWRTKVAEGFAVSALA